MSHGSREMGCTTFSATSRNSYRDLIDSADSIVLMKNSCDAISANISAVHDGILHSLSSETPKFAAASAIPSRSRIYDIACQVKYLIDKPENSWGCLDESMFEAGARYIRAKQVHHSLIDNKKNDNIYIIQCPSASTSVADCGELQGIDLTEESREAVASSPWHWHCHADALAAIVIIDKLEPK